MEGEKEAGSAIWTTSLPQLDNSYGPSKHRQYSSGMALRASSGSHGKGVSRMVKVPGLETVGPTPIETS